MVLTDVRKDERVQFIADHCGYSRREALGGLVDLWCWCADRRLQDAPEDCDGYAVPDAIVRRFLGERGVEALLGDGCHQLALGTRRDDGLIHLHGTENTVRSLRGLARSSSAGGHARADAADQVGPTGRSAGRFVKSTTNHTKTPSAGVIATNLTEHHSHECVSNVLVDTITPAVHQPSTSRPPAVTSVDTINHIPDREEHPPLPPSSGGEPKSRRKSQKDRVVMTEAESASFERIMAKLAKVAGHKFRGAEAHKRLVVARLREGIDELELRAVIAHCADKWENDSKMQQFLTPETLFGPQTIHRYLDAAVEKYKDSIDAERSRMDAARPQLRLVGGAVDE